MAKKKSKKEKTQSKAKSVKNLVKKEYTDEEKARLAKHQERKRRKPVKFKTVKSDSDNPTIALQDPDEPLLAVTISEALGTVDFDMQVHCQDIYKQELHCYLILGFWGWPANGCSKRSSLSDIVNHVNGKCQVILIKAKTANRTSTSTAALSILISCVLDSMYFQTNIQIDAIRHIRKMQDITFIIIRFISTYFYTVSQGYFCLFQQFA